MIDINIVNFLTVGLISLIALAAFNFAMPMIGINPGKFIGGS
jgi:hypothetical protein